MPDQRLGRDTAANPNRPMASGTPRRRPAFRTPEGTDVEADHALDAARARGRIRGDLRGTPTAHSPRPSHVQAEQSRRRRPAVGGREERASVEDFSLRDTDHEMDDETRENPRANRRGARDPREYTDREFSEDRELTDDDRLAILRAGYFQVVLPDLPKKAGQHRIWLTTTNPRDTIAGRLRMGYRLLRFEDLGPGWEQQKVTSGEYAGCIVINEMIAAELPQRLYQLYSNELHHRMPRERERGIFGRLDEAAEGLAERGSRLMYEEGEDNAFHYMRANNPRAREFE